jgi:hypothetical protein
VVAGRRVSWAQQVTQMLPIFVDITL